MKKKKDWQALVAQLDPKNFQEPPCLHAGVCGGCVWQNLRYDAQLELKHQMINRAFSEAGHEEQIDRVIPCPDPFYYRNRMDYVIGWKGEVGLKEYGSWSRYVDLSTCLLLDEETPKILQTVRELMRDLKLEPWDAKFHRGLVRYCVVRLGKNTGERMITLVVHDLARFDDAVCREITRRLAPLCTTLYLGENPDTTDLSLAKTLKLLHGNEYLTEEVNGLRYLIHPNSFFQTNSTMAAELQKTVLAFLKQNKTIDSYSNLLSCSVLDLYCGLGFFGIACAKQGATVEGYELDVQAIELAKRNAEINGVADRTTFGAGAIESLCHPREGGDLEIPAFAGMTNYDAVIIDPPRSGLHPRVLKTLLDQAPKTIIYVSCNYKRLVEELKEFKTKYHVEQIAALDLFPQTPHVEVVVQLKKPSE
ncbi:23S rRNA (uracil(1939)-C(5))-methyltransferase RlmD [Candidatus Uhrbacteria bacterium]|nr:23S rRNA (uracil(1939)-C(5))-methyltransferase RlmD [Candidatus Uhrbacteria bacterium]